MNLQDLHSRLKFGEFLTEEGVTGLGVEVGVAYGENAERILEQWRGDLFLVDPYVNQDRSIYRDGTNGIDMEACFQHAQKRLMRFPVRRWFIREFSPQAADKCPNDSLAFVYLDGNHSYEAVRADLEAWYPKVRMGGILGGHDFVHVDNDLDLCEVPKAVTEFCIAKRLMLWLTDVAPENPSWWVVKG